MTSRPILTALHVFASVIVGVIVMFAVQILVTRLWGVAGVHWSSSNLPVASIQQFAALSTLFLVIFVSTLAAALAARRRAVVVLSILVVLGIVIDGYAMFFRVGDALPLWFRICFVAQIPLATMVGWMLIRRRLGLSLERQ